MVPSPGLTGVQEPGEVTVVMPPDGQSELPGTVMMLVIVPCGGQVDGPPVGPTGVDPVPVPVQSLQLVVSRGKRATGFAFASKLLNISTKAYARSCCRTSSLSLQARCD